MKKHLQIRISGRVQGVYFRKTAQKEAEKWGITGFIQNMDDGTVYIEAEGKPMPLDLFVKWCYKGPDNAKVNEVTTNEGELKNFDVFEVRH